jgi:hypothetical protein
VTRGSGIIDFTDGHTVRSHGDRAISVENINDPRSFHHIDIDSIMLDPTCGSGSAVRAAEITRGEVCVPSIWRCPKRTGTD